MFGFDLDEVWYWELIEQPHSPDDIRLLLNGVWPTLRCLAFFLLGVRVQISEKKYEIVQVSLYQWSAQAQLKQQGAPEPTEV